MNKEIMPTTSLLSKVAKLQTLPHILLTAVANLKQPRPTECCCGKNLSVAGNAHFPLKFISKTKPTFCLTKGFNEPMIGSTQCA